MTTRHWYPHYVRDFKAKTGHLSLAEKGAYRALMDEYWERQGPLPADDKALCRLVGAFPEEWAEVRDSILPFFEERDGMLHHRRIDEEIIKANAQAEKMAKVRAAKASTSDEKGADKEAVTSDGTTRTSPTPTPTPSTNTLKTPSPSPAGAVGGVFRIDRWLTDDAREKAKRAAPGWDLHYLMDIYDAGVKERGPPDKPSLAFPAWCARYTKGKSPRAL